MNEDDKIIESKPVKVNTNGNDANFAATIKMPERFSTINRLVMRDLNGVTTSPTFYLYSKDEISTYLKDPYKYEKYLRNAVTYIYGASSHFRRLIQYFVGLTDLDYVVSPYNIDTSTASEKTIKRNYMKVLKTMSAFDVKTQFPKILTVCFREDVFYGTMWVTSDKIIIQQLPSDYCAISTIEDNVFNVTFNFSYFDTYSQYLDFYPDEFRTKYEIYKKDRTGAKWQELDSPTSFAVKVNKDIPSYALPPFAGILRDVYEIEDYRSLKLSKTELENYAMLVMKLGVNSDGEWEMDFGKAKEFFNNLSAVLPEEIGAVLSPMEINKISFEKSNTGDTDEVAEAERSLYSAAGVNAQLFNNENASANALLLSIKVDQKETFAVVKSIEDVINRYIHSLSYGKYFKVNFLDISQFNRKEQSDAYLKACSYGMPMISYYAAAQGLTQDEVDCMSFLESDILKLTDRFKPLAISSTQSSSDSKSSDSKSSDSNSDGEAGRPESDIDDLTDSGEDTRERQ